MENHFLKLLPEIEVLENKKVPVKLWDINQTIGELSYLTHDYFRYYGKFPSTLASLILELYPAPKNGILLDNFSGSGTSLVEASLRKIPSVGIDINPLSVLASKVKTAKYNTNKLRETFGKISELYYEENNNYTEKALLLPDEKFLTKWFTEETTRDLVKLKSILIEIDNKKNRDFFILAFLGIIRRISKAYDGEVRPHINSAKKQREVFSAFSKKVQEMIKTQDEFNTFSKDRIEAKAFLQDSTEDYKKLLPKGKYWLVISHPPYLNCFDYIPVFNLELEWAKELNSVWENKTKKEVRDKEVKSWPAKTEENVKNYYNQLKKAYEVTYKIQPKGGICAVVIGDCTIQGKLEPVHKKMIQVMAKIGYEIKEINYRTTHYSTGKYSYKHRADYHSELEKKKDAILIFKKN